MTFFFSIITVIKNDPIGIKRTNISIKNQTFKNFEWVVKAQDADRKYLEKYKENYYCRQIIYRKDNGIFQAMNQGIENISGKWVIFLNSGDKFFSKNSLENLNKNLKKYNLEHTNLYIIGCKTRVNLSAKHHYFHKPKNLEYYKKLFTYGMPAYHQSQVFSSSALKIFKYDENYLWHADGDLFWKLIKNGAKYTIFNQVILSTFYYDGLSSKFRPIINAKETFAYLKFCKGNSLIARLLPLVYQFFRHLIISANIYRIYFLLKRLVRKFFLM